MGIDEEESRATPPTCGWPSRRDEKAHGIGEIVYHESAKTSMHTEVRCHEQEKVYHKARRGAAPHGPAARDPRQGQEPVRQQAGTGPTPRTRRGLSRTATASCAGGIRSRLTRRQVQDLEDTINSIHRESLNGETAYAYDSRMAQTH